MHSLEGLPNVLVELPGGARALAWAIVWESELARDLFSDRVESMTGGFGGAVAIERSTIGGRPASVLRVGEPFTVRFAISDETS